MNSEDDIDPVKLAKAMLAAKVSEDSLAARLGVPSRYFEKMCHHPMPGFRERLEFHLGLRPGALKL